MTPATDSPVAELRELIAAKGIPLKAGDTIILGRVMEKVGNAGVAADALLMVPRPAWLLALIGRELMKVAA